MPAPLGGFTGIVAVAAGGYHSLALRNDGTVWAAGSNFSGALGNGTTTDTAAAVQVIGLSEVVAIAAGEQHSLALKNDGTIWAWGRNEEGQLGDGTGVNRLNPAPVSGLGGMAATATGNTHSLAVKADGTLWGWGSNRSGQLGKEITTRSSTPVRVIAPGSPDLTIAMSRPGEFTVGRQGVYTLTIANIGRTSTSGVITVADLLPPGLSYVSATGTGWACSTAGQTVTCTNPGPVEPAASSVIDLTVNAGSASHPSVRNFATVSNESDLNTSNNWVDDLSPVFLGRIVVNAVVNGASLRDGPVAPGEIVSIFGKEIGPSVSQIEPQPGLTRVLFDGEDAAVFFVAANQVNGVVPSSVAGKQTTELQIQYGGLRSDRIRLNVADSAPGIFTWNATGLGQGVIFNEDHSMNWPESSDELRIGPAPKGSAVELYATGEGRTPLQVSVQIGGREAETLGTNSVEIYGVSVLTVRARIPIDVESGPAVPIVLIVGEARSQDGVTVAVE